MPYVVKGMDISFSGLLTSAVSLLRKKKYADIEVFVNENQLLRYTDSYKVIIELWDKTVQKAKEYLSACPCTRFRHATSSGPRLSDL